MGLLLVELRSRWNRFWFWTRWQANKSYRYAIAAFRETLRPEIIGLHLPSKLGPEFGVPVSAHYWGAQEERYCRRSEEWTRNYTIFTDGGVLCSKCIAAMRRNG
jgi:hypothetical protein